MCMIYKLSSLQICTIMILVLYFYSVESVNKFLTGLNIIKGNTKKIRIFIIKIVFSN